MEANKVGVEPKILCPLRVVGHPLKEALDEVSKRYCVEGWCAWWVASVDACAMLVLAAPMVRRGRRED